MVKYTLPAENMPVRGRVSLYYNVSPRKFNDLGRKYMYFGFEKVCDII